MTPSQVETTIRHLKGLYPRWPATPELLRALTVRLARLELRTEQAAAYLDEHRMSSRRRAPDLAVLIHGLFGIAESERRQQPPTLTDAPTGDPPISGYEREVAADPKRIAKCERGLSSCGAGVLAAFRGRMAKAREGA